MEEVMERFEDDRETGDDRVLTCLVGGIDTFMSDYGPPKDLGVKSRAYWACRTEDCEAVRKWVENRSDFDDVSVYRFELPEWISEKGDFVHIYVVESGHPALQGAE